MASVRTVSEPQEILAYVQHPPNGEGDSERAALQMCTRLQINMLQIDNAIIQLVLVYWFNAVQTVAIGFAGKNEQAAAHESN